MRVLLKDHLIVRIPESADEKSELDGWRAAHPTHVFCADSDPQALTLHGLGKRADACREPINVVSGSADPAARMISVFCHGTIRA